MLVHAKCGTPLFLDLSSNLEVFMTYGYSSKGLTIGMGDLKFNEESGVKLICPSCRETIELKKGKKADFSEILGTCINCGHRKPIEQLIKPGRSGGIFCLECVKLLDEGVNGTPLYKIIPQINLNR